ncbi:hypothetical protein BGZ60DRAFT_355808, partial [Tricladium varicosporioides]
QDTDLIEKSLKKQPVPLKKGVWQPLYKYDLLRTPQEQRIHLLKRAPVSNMAESVYSRGVIRAIHAILALDVRTKDLHVCFKERAHAELDVLLGGDILQINDRWLDFQASH